MIFSLSNNIPTSGIALIRPRTFWILPGLGVIRQIVVNSLRQIYVYGGATVAVMSAVIRALQVPPDSRHGRQIVRESNVVHKLTLSLGSSAFADVTDLALERKTTPAQTVRVALGLLKVVANEQRKGNHVVVVSSDGKALREIVLPAA